ncbi:MAG TPA: hypothetical protein VGE10_06725 [Zeimonas sp.]
MSEAQVRAELEQFLARYCIRFEKKVRARLLANGVSQADAAVRAAQLAEVRAQCGRETLEQLLPGLVAQVEAAATGASVH